MAKSHGEEHHKVSEKSEVAVLGHMDQADMNTCPRRTTAHTEAWEEDVEVMLIENQEITNYIFTAMGDTVTVRIDTDHIGVSPVVPSQGNRYIFILYNYDSNAILEEPMKSR